MKFYGSFRRVRCTVVLPARRTDWGLRDYGNDSQLGLEPTPEQYVQNMVEVFREVRRVLRKDGTVWLNLGDSYLANQGTGFNAHEKTRPHLSGDGVGQKRIDEANRNTARAINRPSWLKPKDLCGIPWRVAFALQADGWWLRQDIIWHKPNPMPESCTDRCTKAHEYIFLLAKSAKYFYDAEAIADKAKYAGDIKISGEKSLSKGQATGANRNRSGNALKDTVVVAELRNRRSVWTVTTKPYKAAHFATFPPDLIEPCIKAGTSEEGCCPECAAPWARETTREKLTRPRPNDYVKRTGEPGTGNSCANSVAGVAVTTTGWEPTCDCVSSGPVPCTVLDPFNGSGTTGDVCRKLGRQSIGIELNAEYNQLAANRLRQEVLF